MAVSRRQFVGTGSAGLLTFVVGGCEQRMTPGQAKIERAKLQALVLSETRIADALAEQLVPGASKAGIGYFLDHQLAAPADQQLLMIKYLGVPQPWRAFYREGLRNINVASNSLYKKNYVDLNADQAFELASSLAAGTIAGWDGPPQGLFYFVLRSDAVDVVYGTEAGFANLGIPYAAHVSPPSEWGQ
ncbi:MAG: gluconate 2-dehydrogenase subunit 3 family protein [Lysobacterales bacterium]